MKDYSMEINILKQLINNYDSIIIGAGSGLSTSAGFIYNGERLNKYFFDFVEKYNFEDMYSGGFYVLDKKPEEMWAYWSRYIYINRYMNPPKNVYDSLFKLVKDKDYFVLTTNVDHCFQKAGFDSKRLFYTQGDYGLFQCSVPCHNKTYDNEEMVKKMVLAQGFVIEEDGTLSIPKGTSIKMEIPSNLIPYCPVCGKPMSMNLRADDTFVQDEGWHLAAERYSEFMRRHKDTKLMFIELGVGMNTPVIIKYPFWRYTFDNKNAIYVCINYDEAYAPDEIKDRSILIEEDIEKVLSCLASF